MIRIKLHIVNLDDRDYEFFKLHICAWTQTDVDKIFDQDIDLVEQTITFDVEDDYGGILAAAGYPTFLDYYVKSMDVIKL